MGPVERMVRPHSLPGIATHDLTVAGHVQFLWNSTSYSSLGMGMPCKEHLGLFDLPACVETGAFRPGTS